MEKTTAAGVSVDKIDLHIMSLLNANCRTPYRSIASTVGISANAVKTRVKKMISKGIIQQFVTVVNPTILGYEKQCILTVRNIDNIITKEEGYVFNQLNLLGDVWVYAKQLGGDAIFLLLVRPEAEEKIELINTLLKPATIEYRFVMINPPSMNVSISDLKIIKSLLSNARMEIADITKEASVSPRTVTRRIEKMLQNHMIDFRIIRDMSSMNLTGYIQFLLMVAVNQSAYREIIERMYREMQEYIIHTLLNISRSDVIIAFLCSNIPTVDSIVTLNYLLQGVVVYHQEWLVSEINKKLRYPKTTDGLRAVK